MTLLGWGRKWNKTTPKPPIINAVNIDIYDEAECQKKYPRRKLNFTNQLCAGMEVSLEKEEVVLSSRLSTQNCMIRHTLSWKT